MKLSIVGCPDRERFRPYLKRAAEYYAKSLMSEKMLDIISIKIKFDKDIHYYFAMSTRSEGRYPNERYFTTNPLRYVGKYVRSERWGWGDGASGAEYFDNKLYPVNS